MRFTTITNLVVFLCLNFSIFSQKIPEGAVTIDQNTVIKDAEGNVIDMISFMTLMDSGDWAVDPTFDENGKLSFLQLREATEMDKQIMSNFPAGGMPKSSVNGKEAPKFRMETIRGDKISSANTQGKVVVLNFWFASCKPCVAEIPELNELYEQYKNDPNVVFAAITFDDKKKVKAFLKQHPMDYPIVSDVKEVCDAFKVSSYPTNIILDRDGNYFDRVEGGFPQIGKQLDNAIQQALNGKPVVNRSMPSDGMMIDPNATFKLENGEIISFEKAIKLLNNNGYELVPSKENGEESYLLKKQ